MQRTFDFALPVLPLPEALDRYAVVTGRPTIYPSGLVEGRVASAVHGQYDAGAALRMLLRGTGLGAEELRNDGIEAFVLRPVDPDAASAAPVAAPSGAVAPLPVLETYDALVQSRVMASLCADEHTAPGEYRALLRFTIDGAGHVRQARLLGSTGHAGRDDLLAGALNRIDIGRAPPRDLEQPLTLLILPRSQIAGRPCPAGAH